jgi:ribosomal protein S27AE
MVVDVEALALELQEEIDKLRAAIIKHRDQRGDDRCWLDDLDLYAVLDDGVQADNSMPPREGFLANCARYYDNRCRAGNWTTYQELEQKIGELSELVYMPGEWRCPTCHFTLHLRTLYAQTGEVGINLGTPDPCPNDGAAMVRLAYKEDAEAANRVALDMVKENRRLREQLDQLATRQ